MFLLNSCQEIFRCGPAPLFGFNFESNAYCAVSKPKSGAGQALSRSYGRFFAEFLKDPSLVRLGLLDPTTCVGLRYGTVTFMLRSFSRKRAPLICLAEASHSDLT